MTKMSSKQDPFANIQDGELKPRSQLSLKRIGAFISEEDALPPIRAARDLIGREMVLHSFEWKDGDSSEYALMVVSLTTPNADNGETDEEFQLSCGAQTVVTQLQAVDQKNGLPMLITIAKHKETRMLKLI